MGLDGLPGPELAPARWAVACALGTSSVSASRRTPSWIDLWVATLIKHGITGFCLYDCLYDLPTMKRLSAVIHDSVGEPVPSIMYGLTSVHDDAFFAGRAREMAGWPGVGAVYVEDATGVLTPDRAATLLVALRAATGMPSSSCTATTRPAWFSTTTSRG